MRKDLNKSLNKTPDWNTLLKLCISGWGSEARHGRCWASGGVRYLLDVAPMVGAVGDSVTGNVIGSWNPAHPHHTVGDHWEGDAHWWREKN